MVDFSNVKDMKEIAEVEKQLAEHKKNLVKEQKADAVKKVKNLIREFNLTTSDLRKSTMDFLQRNAKKK